MPAPAEIFNHAGNAHAGNEGIVTAPTSRGPAAVLSVHPWCYDFDRVEWNMDDRKGMTAGNEWYEMRK